MLEPVTPTPAIEKNKRSRFRSVVLPAILILAASLVTMAAAWLLYVLVYNLLETLFFPQNPQAFPADSVRKLYAVAWVLLYLLLLRTRLPQLVKAFLLSAPLSTVLITAGLMFYQKPILAIFVMLVMSALCGFWLYKTHKPWFYYVAAGIATLTALAYALPPG